jgi:hypothetical protein
MEQYNQSLFLKYKIEQYLNIIIHYADFGLPYRYRTGLPLLNLLIELIL